MPVGIRAKHYVRVDDALVGQTIGMGPAAPIIRSVAANGVDAIFALVNDMPPESRADAAQHLADLVGTVATIETRGALTTTAESLVDPKGTKLRLDGILSDVQAISRDLASIKAVTPGADELRHDGYSNTPNGPIIAVGPYLDEPALKSRQPLQFVLDQHDFPQMLSARTIFESNPLPRSRAIDERDVIDGRHGSPTPSAQREHNSAAVHHLPKVTMFRDGKPQTVEAYHHDRGTVSNIGPFVAIRDLNEKSDSVTLYPRAELLASVAPESRAHLAASLLDGNTTSIARSELGVVVTPHEQPKQSHEISVNLSRDARSPGHDVG